MFYDVVDIDPTVFTIKEEAPTTVTTNKSPYDIHGASSEETVPQDSTGVNQKSDEIRNSESSDADNLDMIGADVSEVYEDLPELSDLINRQNAQTRGRVYSDASIRSAAAEILNAAGAEVADAKRGELELMLRNSFVNWSRRGISVEAFME